MIEDEEQESPKESLRYVRDGLADLADTIDDIDLNELDNWNVEKRIINALRLLQRAQSEVLTALRYI